MLDGYKASLNETSVKIQNPTIISGYQKELQEKGEYQNKYIQQVERSEKLENELHVNYLF